jgi:ribosomal-protein-alanine N-acetyltransferase
MNEPNIMQYFPRTDPPDMERVRALIGRQLMQYETYHLGWWAVVPQGQSDLIGWNGLQYLPETDEVEVAYLLGKQFWGRGYATEGAEASLKFGFETLGLKQIIGLTHPENLASQNVLKKCGMYYTGQKVYFGMQLNRYILSNPVKA